MMSNHFASLFLHDYLREIGQNVRKGRDAPTYTRIRRALRIKKVIIYESCLDMLLEHV